MSTPDYRLRQSPHVSVRTILKFPAQVLEPAPVCAWRVLSTPHRAPPRRGVCVMAARTQFGLLCTAVFLSIISGPVVIARQQTAPQDRVLPDFDIRVGRPAVSAARAAAAEMRRPHTTRG